MTSLPPLNSVHLAIILPLVAVYVWCSYHFSSLLWRPLLPLEEVCVCCSDNYRWVTLQLHVEVRQVLLQLVEVFVLKEVFVDGTSDSTHS